MSSRKTVRWNRIGGWGIRYDFLEGYHQPDVQRLALERFSAIAQGDPDVHIIFAPETANKTRVFDMSAAAPDAAYRYGMLFARIRRADDGGSLWAFGKETLDTVIFSASADWKRIELLLDVTDTLGVLAYHCLFEVAVCAFLSLGGLVIHGALMDCRGRGVILSAPSGTGKTTHARMWRDEGYATIINGDKALCRLVDGVWTGFGMPWCGTSGESENRSVPLAAVVFLEQAGENSLTRLSAADALFHLLQNIHAPRWEPALFNKALDRLDELIPAVPMYLLRCRPDLDAVHTLKREMDRLPGMEAGA